MRVAIVGAGITGLAAAWFHVRAGHDVIVLERSSRAGGVAGTRIRDGFLLEDGPVSIRGGGAAVAELLEGLGLVPLLPAARSRYLLRDGGLVPVPDSLSGVFWTGLLSVAGRLRLLGEPFVRRPAKRDPAETVAAFVGRRLGAEVADVLLDPMIGGITAGDPATLDVAAVFPRLVEAERDAGSLVRGLGRGPAPATPRGTMSFPGGLGALVDALVRALGDRIHLDAPVDDLATLKADRVVLTCDPETVAAWIPDFRPPTLPRAPVASVALGYAADDVPGGLPGFGWLAHSRERRDVLGCLWISGVIPAHAPSGHHLLRVMIGGARAPELVGQTDDVLVAHARQILADVQHIHADPVLTDVVRSRPGIPQYPPGWADFLARTTLPAHITLAGWHYSGVGVADGITAARGLAARG